MKKQWSKGACVAPYNVSGPLYVILSHLSYLNLTLSYYKLLYPWLHPKLL
jgi:hypothetical protein